MKSLPTLTSAVVSVAFLGGSVFLLHDHARAIAEMRETGIPAAMELQALEKRMDILREQNELAELQAALVTGSQQEQVDVYVLPGEASETRALAGLDLVLRLLQRQGQILSLSPVTVGEVVHDSNGSTALPLSFHVRVTREGWDRLVLFTRVSGLLTVGDLLSDADLQSLLRLTEDENPATVAAFEQFFRTDLLRYVEEPRSVESQLMKSFSTDATLESFHAFLASPEMQTARSLLGELAPDLRAARLWPLQFMRLRTADIRLNEDGSIEADVTVGAYGRIE